MDIKPQRTIIVEPVRIPVPPPRAPKVPAQPKPEKVPSQVIRLRGQRVRVRRVGE